MLLITFITECYQQVVLQAYVTLLSSISCRKSCNEEVLDGFLLVCRKEKEVQAWRIKDSLYRIRHGRYSAEQYHSHVQIGHKLLVLTSTRIICVTASTMERRWSIHTKQIHALAAEFESVVCHRC